MEKVKDKELEEEKKKKKNRQLILILARYYKLITTALIVVIIAFGYYFILKPKYQQVAETGGDYNSAAMEVEIIKRQNYLKDLATLVANYQKINQADLKKLTDILPAEADIPGLFVQLQALAESHGLLLTGVSINDAPEIIGQNETEGKIKKLNISIDLIGSANSGYTEIKEFLAILENNLRLFDVNAVYFSPDSPDYSVDIFTYFYPN